jgi:AmmeMemoRadiSam system protein B/AmmeMemoRadiSam system protein A
MLFNEFEIMPYNSNSNNIRPPAIAGTFYPNNPVELEATIKYFLNEAVRNFGPAVNVPKAIIVPHAGYIYSGLTAAAVYNRLQPAREVIKRVVILGPCHCVAINGIALPSTEIFQTPLGNILLDKDSITSILNLDSVEVFNETHVNDHSIEIHLPFLQKILADFKLVPLIVGDSNPEKIAEVLDVLWGGPETLILISSDLSHYLRYDQAKMADSQTRIAIEQMDLNALGKDQACGFHSVKGLLMLAKAKGLSVTTADIRNSGDTAGTKDRVVGYGSWYFDENNTKNMDTENKFDLLAHDILRLHGNILLRFVASTIFSQLLSSKTTHAKLPQLDPILNEPGASFITLNKKGQLRGCVGSVQAWQPLIKDITQNACKAAFEDPRFPQLTLLEIESGEIEISISIVSPQTQMYFLSENDLLEQLKPDVDGIVLIDGTQHRSVFLPSVWEQLPNPKQFINQLKRKAGLPENHWSETIQIWRYITASTSSTKLPVGQKLWPT